ncbi:putative lipid II flippase FtsW [Mesosutterella sp. AGMB02718]|uniref:Probable peptidoglycan glycosyltransferase FtsW n=1 Tax=Mesosutterella faecium TaxID=2925194 RepID=A0ABT7IJU5_9BURK|nr:putative lipid II flippase FtsW [Mesosutterella sp. AGMB02718]MDL2058643.1 putative lipid II flippase FtsW [Mesosutterella sp. AGMB02718]
MLDRLRGRLARRRKDEDALRVEAVYPNEMSTPVSGGRLMRGRSLDFDWVVVAVVSLLLGLGTVMVYSASISLADSPKYGTSQTYFLTRHLISLAISLAAAYGVYHVPMRAWLRLAKPLGVLAVLLLVLVLVPGVGVSVNGSRRWIRFPFMNLQVSEFTKFVAVIFASYFTLTRQDYMHSFRKGFLPMALAVGAVAALLIVQPDLGATIVVIAIVMGVLFVGGLSYKIFFLMVAAVAGLVASMIIWTPWRLSRVVAYLDPWNEENVLGKAYQLSHSLIALGRGEIFGAGLGGSVEKLNYLPEAHTDFIFAVIGEELGFVGVVVVLFLYYRLIRSAFEIGRIAVKMDNVFSGLVAQGVGIWIGVQVCINVGVATGLLPTKGLTLPLMSYGGSAILSTLCGIALLLRVDHENRVLMHGGQI